MKYTIIFLIACIITLSACNGHNGHYKLRSGGYGYYLDIVVSPAGAVYGQYELYQKWNRQGKFYEQQMRFYFYGNKRSHDTFFVNVGPLGDTPYTGKIVLRSNDSISFFTNFCCGYTDVDFEEDGYQASANKDSAPDIAIALGVVKDEKCPLYRQPADTAITRGYIVNNDFVDIYEKRGQWLKIRYNSNFDTTSIIRWIKASALYDDDPAKWSN